MINPFEHPKSICINGHRHEVEDWDGSEDVPKEDGFPNKDEYIVGPMA